MRGAELVAQLVELFLSYFKVLHDFLEVPFWHLTVESPDQPYSFFPGQVLVAYLLRGVIGGTPQTKLDVGRVVM